jgi:hypothetical protein
MSNSMLFLLIECILELKFFNFFCVYHPSFVIPQDAFNYLEKKLETDEVMLI